MDPGPNRVVLTEQQHAQALDMYARGVAINLIARALGVNASTLTHLLRRGGYRPTTERQAPKKRDRRKPGKDRGLDQPGE